MAPKRVAQATRSFNFGSAADFLGSAIKDAGPSAQLPLDPLPAPGPVPVPAPVTRQEPTTAASKKKRAGKKAAKVKTTLAVTDTRRLVTVKKVSTVEQFNKDHNLVQIEGWAVIAPRFKEVAEGELVVFVETDTFLPMGGDSQGLFAEVGNETAFEGQRGYLVKPKKHVGGKNDRTVLSQGHVYQLADLPKIWEDYVKRRATTEDFDRFVDEIRQVDYTSLLAPGVRKWVSDAERAASIPGPAAGPVALKKFPGFIPKTNITRVQNCPNLFLKPKYLTQTFQESKKMDGSSMTVYFVSHEDMKKPEFYSHFDPPSSDRMAYYTIHETGRLGVCSKERDLPFDYASPFWKAALEQEYHVTLPKLGKTVAIQGELVGHNIQGNPHRYALDTHCFFVYSIMEPVGQKKWDPRKVEIWATEHNLKHVPVLGYHIIPHIARHHEDLLIRADLHIGDEGLVFKNCQDGRWFKVHSRFYLLEQEKKSAPVPHGKGKAAEKKDDDYPGYEMPDEEFDQLIENYESGKLDNDAGVQAFVKEWDNNWNSVSYSTIPSRLLGKDAKVLAKIKEHGKEACAWLRV